MKTILAALFLMSFAVQGHSAEEIMVTVLSNAKATLSDGKEFMIEQGDNYPFVAYDQTQTLVQLKLGPYTFWARKNNVTFVPEADVPKAKQKYEADAKPFLAEMAKQSAAPEEREAPASRPAPKVELITAKAVKDYWLRNIVEPRSLDANYHQVRDANMRRRHAIESGQYDGLAQDEANRLNIDMLRQNGYSQEADSLQQARNDYAARVAAARQQAEQKQQMDDMTSSLRNQMLIQQNEMQRQTRELQDISRQLRR